MTCSVTQSTGNLKDCEWIFAGSYSTIGKAGALAEVSRSFHCKLPVKGTLAQLVTTLTGAGTGDPIQRPLPGETSSAYDALGGCLP